MNISRSIAQRYLFAKKQFSLQSVLSYISISGITIGAALLISVLSIFNGFFSVIQGFLLGYDPELRVESVGGAILEWNQEVENYLRSHPQIASYTPYVEGMALMRVQKKNGLQPYENRVIQLKGIALNSSEPTRELDLPISQGSSNVERKEGKAGVLIPEYLRAELQLEVGDELVLLSARYMRRALTQISMPRTMMFTVRGVYQLPYVSSPPPILMDLETAHRLFVTRNKISGIDLSLFELEDAEPLKKELTTQASGLFSGKVQFKTWYDLQKPLYDVMYLEKWGAFIVLMIIILVAALNILGSLSMIVIQKKRDIGILRAMGMTSRNIQGIFIRQGLIIGMVGALLGGGIGLVFSFLQDQYGILKLSSAFIIDSYPVQIQALDVVFIMLGTMALSLLASWLPAKRASELEPARVIRYE
jgi:lipoprotein-releasing system permease protein